MRNRLLALIGAAVLLGGCVTREDIRGLQTDIYGIQKGLESKTENVQTNQADLAQDMQNLRESLTALQTELQDNLAQMRALSIRMDDMESSLGARMDAQIELLSGSKFVEKPLPSTMFNLANTDYTRGKDAEAVNGFNAFIKQYPKSEAVAEAKFKVAEIMARQSKETEALQVLENIISEHPKSPFASSAMLKKGKILEEQGHNQAALQVYQTLIKAYPYSAEARAAQQNTAELQNKK